MTKYENLVEYANSMNVKVVELPITCDGLCVDNYIFLRDSLTSTQKYCVLTEEIAHYQYNTGDITDQKKTENRKQELFARKKAYEAIVPFNEVITLLKSGDQLYDIAEKFDLTEQFLREALTWYISNTVTSTVLSRLFV